MFGRAKLTRTLLSLLLATGTLQASISSLPQSEFRRTYALSATGRVVVQNLYGDVRITTWDRDEVLVQAIKRSRDPRQLKDAQIVVDSSAESVSIRTLYAGTDAERPASVEYRITVPRTANLENIRLVNGGLSISGVAGSVKASSVNGNIKADGLEGHADLSTVNGQLEAEFDRVSAANSISLSSVNGPIRLSIPSGSGAQLTASNRSGGIQSEFGRVSRASTGHRLRTTVNRGGAQIHLNNVNGGISIRASWNRRAERPWS